MISSHDATSTEIIKAISHGLDAAMAPDLSAMLIESGWDMYFNGKYPFILIWDHVMNYSNPVARICLDWGRGRLKRHTCGLPVHDYEWLVMDLINLDGTCQTHDFIYSLYDPKALDEIVSFLKCVDSSVLSQTSLDETSESGTT